VPGRRGGLLDPRSREYAWVATAIHAVARRSGQQSRWNKRVYFELSGLEGAAGPDGGMSVSDATVLEPLRRAYAGEQLTDAELSGLRDALVTLTHESLHLCHELQNSDGAVQLSAAELALEEGLAENWAQENVNHVIRAMKLDVQHPALLTQQQVNAYPALQAGTTELIEGVTTLSGLRDDEVVRQLQAVNATERLGVIADLVIEGQLGQEAYRPELRAQLERTLQEQFAPVLTVEQDRSLDAEAQARHGAEIGTLAAAEVERVLAEPDTARQPGTPQQQVHLSWEEQVLAWQKEQAQPQPAEQTFEQQVLAWQNQQAAARASQREGVEHLQKFFEQGPGRVSDETIAEAPGTPADPRHLIARRDPRRGHGVAD
jgi:hypothetical protein